MVLDLFDFDGTIYRGDSSVDFLWFCIRRKPSLSRYLVPVPATLALHLLGLVDRTTLKEMCFALLRGIEDLSTVLSAFWSARRDRIAGWYLAREHGSDVIVSASPEFLLTPICAMLGVSRLVATIIDGSTGRVEGRNCRGKEKLARFREAFPDAQIRDFFSDSRADGPLAAAAQHAYRVSGDRVSGWPKEWGE
jgi:phosphatidylglycerophosphatase C